MQLTLSTAALSEAEGDLLVMPVFEAEIADAGARSQAFLAVDAALQGALSEAAAQENFTAKAEAIFAMHALGRVRSRRVLLVGLGDSSRFEVEGLRMAAGRVAKFAAKTNARSLTFALPDMPIDRPPRRGRRSSPRRLQLPRLQDGQGGAVANADRGPSRAAPWPCADA